MPHAVIKFYHILVNKPIKKTKKRCKITQYCCNLRLLETTVLIKKEIINIPVKYDVSLKIYTTVKDLM